MSSNARVYSLVTFLTKVNAFAHANTLTGMLTHGVSEKKKTKQKQRQKLLSINGSELHTLNSRLINTKEARENPYHYMLYKVGSTFFMCTRQATVQDIQETNIMQPNGHFESTRIIYNVSLNEATTKQKVLCAS